MRTRDEVLEDYDFERDGFEGVVEDMADRIRELEEDRENGAQWFDAYQRLENALWDAVGLDHVPEPDSNGHPNTVNLACVSMLRARIRELESRILELEGQLTEAVSVIQKAEGMVNGFMDNDHRISVEVLRPYLSRFQEVPRG